LIIHEITYDTSVLGHLCPRCPTFQRAGGQCPRNAPSFRRPWAWCLHHYNCLLFIIIPPVTDVHVMLKKIEC